mgnify:FL=1
MKYANKAAEDLKTFIKKFQPLIDVANVLEQIGSFDNAVEEVKKAKAEADKVHADALSKKEEALDELAAVKKQVEAAKELAEKYVAGGKEKAHKILNDANEAAKGVEAVAFKKLEEAEKIKKEAFKAKDDLSLEIAAKQVELNDLNAKVNEVKARLANFLK